MGYSKLEDGHDVAFMRRGVGDIGRRDPVQKSSLSEAAYRTVASQDHRHLPLGHPSALASG